MAKEAEKVAVVGFETKPIEKELMKEGFVLDKLKPDIVVSFGGDGSALSAEQLYPCVPRLTIKHSRVCKKCEAGKDHDFSDIVKKLKKRRYKIIKEHKVEGIVNDDNRKRLIGLNEINIANAMPIRAIRFDVKVNGKKIADGLIGDGVVVATPYGSAAYFYAIAGRRFSKRLGIAFNNINKKMKYRFANLNSTVKVNIERGPGFMCADNNTTMVPLEDGDVVKVKMAKEKAKIIKLRGEKTKISV